MLYWACKNTVSACLWNCWVENWLSGLVGPQQKIEKEQEVLRYLGNIKHKHYPYVPDMTQGSLFCINEYCRMLLCNNTYIIEYHNHDMTENQKSDDAENHTWL